jgi:hypothetical protein
VADNRQFGSPKVPGNQQGDATHCAQCESMLADALDGTLTPADQTLFDTHIAHCGPCSQMLADARRGVAWLEMLRDPRPEPPAALLERILAQTSGTQLSSIHSAHTLPGIPAYSPGYLPNSTLSGKILPFHTRFVHSVSQVILQPRLAMTAAMAFFSIALTMNLTGVRLQDLRASDLAPANLQRDFYSVNTHVVQYYEGLRVVYELESRVHELESTTDNDTPADTQQTPSSTQPPAQTPSAQPAPLAPPQNQPARKRPAPNPGTSHSEDINLSRRQIATTNDTNRNSIHARRERILA